MIQGRRELELLAIGVSHWHYLRAYGFILNIESVIMSEIDGFLFLQYLNLILTDFFIDFTQLVRQLGLKRRVLNVDTQGVGA